MEDIEEIHANVRSCIISSKTPLTLAALNRDYDTIIGEPVPYRQCGYSSLEEFLKSVPNVAVTQKSGQLMVSVKPSEKTAHIAQLVRGQKQSSSKKQKSRHFPYKSGGSFLFKNSNNGPRSSYYEKFHRNRTAPFSSKVKDVPKPVPQPYNRVRAQGHGRLFDDLKKLREGEKSYNGRSDNVANSNNMKKTIRDQDLEVERSHYSRKSSNNSIEDIDSRYSHRSSSNSIEEIDKVTLSLRRSDSSSSSHRVDHRSYYEDRVKRDPNLSVTVMKSPQQGIHQRRVSFNDRNYIPVRRSYDEDLYALNSHEQNEVFYSDEDTLPQRGAYPRESISRYPAASDERCSSTSDERRSSCFISPSHFLAKAKEMSLNVQSDPNVPIASYLSRSQQYSQPVYPVSSSVPFEPLRYISSPRQTPVPYHLPVLPTMSPIITPTNTPVSPFPQTSVPYRQPVLPIISPVITPATTPASVTNNMEGYCQKLEELTRLWNLQTPEYNVVSRFLKADKCTLFWCSIKVGEEKFSLPKQEEETEELARQMCAKVAYEQLVKHLTMERQKRITPPSAASLSSPLLAGRISKLLTGHPSGVFKKFIEEQYLEVFQDVLPSNWLDQIANHVKLIVDTTAAGTVISLQEIVPIEIDVSLEPVTVGSVLSLPKIELPSSDSWNIFVCFLDSAYTMWFRLIGPGYDDEYEELANDMDSHYSKIRETGGNTCEKHIGAYYAAFMNGNWYRVQLLKITGNEFKCFLVDHGDTEIVPVTDLYPLDAKFMSLPRQALRGFLFGLEKYDCVTDEKVLNVVSGRSVVATIEQRTPEQLLMTLYDTSDSEEDINLNELLISLIRPFQVPEVNRTVQISLVSLHPSGVAYVQIIGKQLKFLRSLLRAAEEDIERQPELYIVEDPSEINVDKMYLVRYAEDGTWNRGKVIKLDDDRKHVEVLYIDYGNVEICSIEDIVNIDHFPDGLDIVPPQALEVQLNKLNEKILTDDMIERVRNLMDDSDQLLLMKVVKSEPVPIVELFTRMPENNEISSVNEVILNWSSEKAMKELSKLYVNDDKAMDERLPNVVSEFRIGGAVDVTVSLIASPSNFVFHLSNYKTELECLITKMTDYYNELKLNNASMLPITSHGYFAFQHNGSWYRALVDKIFSESMASVRLVDIGDMQIAIEGTLLPLCTEFKKLPIQAVRSSLAGIKPINGDWTPNDVLKFKEMAENKKLRACVFKLNENGRVSVRLFEGDQEIGGMLVTEGRAIDEYQDV